MSLMPCPGSKQRQQHSAGMERITIREQRLDQNANFKALKSQNYWLVYDILKYYSCSWSSCLLWAEITVYSIPWRRLRRRREQECTEQLPRDELDQHWLDMQCPTASPSKQHLIWFSFIERNQCFWASGCYKVPMVLLVAFPAFLRECTFNTLSKESQDI